MSRDPGPSRFRSRTSLGVVAALVLIELLVVATALRTVLTSRQDQYDEARATNENLARVLGESLEGTLRLVDFALLEAKTEIERELAAGGLSGDVLEPHLARLYAQLPFVDAIRTADAAGRITHGINLPRGLALNVADRDYFLLAKAAPSDMVISAPLVSRATGRRSLVFARRVDLPDGAFGGAVGAVVQLDQFAHVLSRVKIARHGAIALRGRDMALIARYPEATDVGMGHRAVSPEMKAALESGRTEGSFVAMSPVVKRESVTAFRRVGDGAFLLVVASSPEDFLEGWRAQAARTWATTAVFALLLAAGGWLLLRTFRRESAARFHALVDQAPIAIALTRGSEIIYVNAEFVRTLGLPAAEAALGRSIVDSIPPEDAERIAARMERRMRGLPVDPTAELTLRRPDGSSFRAAVTDAAVEFAGGPAVIGFIQDVTERRRAEAERERLIGDLKLALAEVKTLSGLLPICSHCKKVRDDHGYWNRIETFIRERSGAEFTHGICPDCARQFFPDDEDEAGGETGGGTGPA